jgi:AcrR family transcriptional regulator
MLTLNINRRWRRKTKDKAGNILEKRKPTIKEIRKKEILDAAKKVFIAKGFSATTMENIIAETSLSKGGFYYYYKSTVDILHDLMREGMSYRVSKMNEFMANYSGGLDKQALAEMLVDKMLDESDLMSVYVIYLQALKNNTELRGLYPVLVEETLDLTHADMTNASIGDFECFATDFMMYFMNTIMLGCEILDAREIFVKNRKFFIEVIKLYFEYYDKEK